jgi:hypothetical protein
MQGQINTRNKCRGKCARATKRKKNLVAVLEGVIIVRNDDFRGILHKRGRRIDVKCVRIAGQHRRQQHLHNKGGRIRAGNTSVCTPANHVRRSPE